MEDFWQGNFGAVVAGSGVSNWLRAKIDEKEHKFYNSSTNYLA